MKKILLTLFLVLTLSANVYAQFGGSPGPFPGAGGTTDLTTSNSWTIGDGSSGDVIFTFNGDAGTDGTQTWDVSEDAFVYNSILKLFSDPACTPDTTGDLCFDTDILAA